MKTFSALLLLIREIIPYVAATWRKFQEHKRDAEIERIKADPDTEWDTRFGRMPEPASDDQQARAMPAADTGAAGSGRRWDGEPGPE